MPTVMAFAATGACSDEEEPRASDEPSTESADGCGDDSQAPSSLECTGLYSDLGAKSIAVGVRSYTPAIELWSDGAQKSRFILFPEGAHIDTSRPDDWSFPVGTRVWKEFRHGERRVETRYLKKVRADRWLAASYVWSPEQTSAVRHEGADLDLDGTPYHVPTTGECSECHDGRADRLLGFEALGLGLPGATGVTLATLAAEGLIDPIGTVAVVDDGTGKSAAALGWLHMNCGVSCHNATSTATAYGTGLLLKLGVAELRDLAPREWTVYKTTLDVPVRTPTWSGQVRIVPGDPERSLLLRLLSARGSQQMPPIATRLVDEEHRSAVQAWIEALPSSPSGDGGIDDDAGSGDAGDASTGGDAAADAADGAP